MKFFTPVCPSTGDYTGQVICQKCIELDWRFDLKRGAIQELAMPNPCKGCSICGETPRLEDQPQTAIDCPPTGEQLKQRGQDRVMLNERKAWKAAAMDQIVSLCMTKYTITADDVREAVIARNIGPPHHPNVYGALMKAAASNGWITKTGQYQKSEIASRHAGMLMVWRSLIS